MSAAWSSTEGSGGGMVRLLVGLGTRLVEGHTFIVDTFEDKTFFPLPPLELLPSLPSPISLSLPSREVADGKTKYLFRLPDLSCSFT